jgi:Crp-like helix-turn-helix domain
LSGGKVARLLLSWDSERRDPQSPLKLTLTHEEIGEIIGPTCETESYLFSEYKKKELLQINGATLVICDKPALEKMVHA